MSSISNYISKKNNNGEKVLSIFLTSGFPDKDNFSELAIEVLNSGADMLEIGFPFSDPLADGPTIQQSSQISLEAGVNLKKTFKYVEEIRRKSDKPIILMGYANPVLNYGLEKFVSDSKSAKVNGIIIPDVPIDEYENFFNKSFKDLDVILLATPTTSDERLKKIDDLSNGFVYYVSMTGTTGNQIKHDDSILTPIKKAYSLIKKNKMLIGFGISNSEDVKMFSPYCSGVIVGSAVIKSLINDDKNYTNTLKLIKELKSGLSL